MTPSRERVRKLRFGRRPLRAPISSSSNLPHSTCANPTTPLADRGFSPSSTLIKLRHTNRRLCQKLNERGADMRLLREENVKLQRELMDKCEEVAIVNAQCKLRESRLDAMAALLVDCITLYRQLGSNLNTAHSEISTLAQQTQSQRLGSLSATTLSCSPPSSLLFTDQSRLTTGERVSSNTKSSGSDSDSLSASDKRNAAKRRKMHRVLPSISGCVISRPSIVLSRVCSEQAPLNSSLLSPTGGDPGVSPPAGGEQGARRADAGTPVVVQSSSPATPSVAATASRTVTAATSCRSPVVFAEPVLSTSCVASRQSCGKRRSSSSSTISSQSDVEAALCSGTTLSPSLSRLSPSALCPRHVRVLVADCGGARGHFSHDWSDVGGVAGAACDSSAVVAGETRRSAVHNRRSKVNTSNSLKKEEVSINGGETIEASSTSTKSIDIAVVGCSGDSARGVTSDSVEPSEVIQASNADAEVSAPATLQHTMSVPGPDRGPGTGACTGSGRERSPALLNPAESISSPDGSSSSTGDQSGAPPAVEIDETVICRHSLQCDPVRQRGRTQLLLNSTADTTLGTTEPPVCAEDRRLSASIAENTPLSAESAPDVSPSSVSSLSCDKKRKDGSKSTNDIFNQAVNDGGVVKSEVGVAEPGMGVAELEGGVACGIDTDCDVSNVNSTDNLKETTIIERRIARGDTLQHREMGLRLMNDTLDTTMVQLNSLPSLTTMSEVLASEDSPQTAVAVATTALSASELFPPLSSRPSSLVDCSTGSGHDHDDAVSESSESHCLPSESAIKQIISRLESQGECGEDEPPEQSSPRSASPSDLPPQCNQTDGHSATGGDSDGAAITSGGSEGTVTPGALSNSWLYRLDPLEGPSNKVWTCEEVQQRELQRAGAVQGAALGTAALIESDWKLSARPVVVISRMSLFDSFDKPMIKSRSGRKSECNVAGPQVSVAKAKSRLSSGRARVKCLTLE